MVSAELEVPLPALTHARTVELVLAIFVAPGDPPEDGVERADTGAEADDPAHASCRGGHVGAPVGALEKLLPNDPTDEATEDPCHQCDEEVLATVEATRLRPEDGVLDVVLRDSHVLPSPSSRSTSTS